MRIAVENPIIGQFRVSNEFRKNSLIVLFCGVRSIWLRHDLYTFKLRLKTLDAQSAKEGIVLIESQLTALERAKEEKKIYGGIVLGVNLQFNFIYDRFLITLFRI